MPNTNNPSSKKEYIKIKESLNSLNIPYSEREVPLLTVFPFIFLPKWLTLPPKQRVITVKDENIEVNLSYSPYSSKPMQLQLVLRNGYAEEIGITQENSAEFHLTFSSEENKPRIFMTRNND